MNELDLKRGKLGKKTAESYCFSSSSLSSSTTPASRRRFFSSSISENYIIMNVAKTFHFMQYFTTALPNFVDLYVHAHNHITTAAQNYLATERVADVNFVSFADTLSDSLLTSRSKRKVFQRCYPHLFHTVLKS